MQVEKLDAYALRSHAFTLRRTNTYFTCPTVLLSFAIIAAAILLNLATISHLWLPRPDLPLLSSQTIAFPGALTSTLVCYRSNAPALNKNASLPQARIYSQNKELLNFPFRSQEEVMRERPQLAKQMGNNFGCFDLAGFSFSQTAIKLRIEVQSADATLFLQSLTESQVIQSKQSKLMALNSTSRTNRGRQVRMLSCVIKDTLMVNADPQIVTTFYYDDVPLLTSILIDEPITNHTVFVVQLMIPQSANSNQFFNYNLRTLSITRLDLGFIMGAVLSWISTLALICSFVVGPLLEKSFALLQIELLFQIPPHLQKPSFIYFLVASFRSGIYPKEDAFVKLEQRLDPLKDVGLMLKLLKTLRPLYHQNSPSLECQVIASEESFTYPEDKDLPQSAYFKGEEEQAGRFDASGEIRKQGEAEGAVKSALKWLDVGSQSVSIYFFRRGHGSKLSVFLTAVFLGGFIAFLFYFRFLRYTSASTTYDLISQQPITYQFSPNQIMFTSVENAQLFASLLDEECNVISSLTVLSSPDCLLKVTQQQAQQLQANGQHYYCFQQSIILQQSSKVASLYVDNANFFYGNLAAFHFPPVPPPFNPVDNFVLIAPVYPGVMVYHSEAVAVTTVISQDLTEATYAHFTPLLEKSNAFCPLTGLNIRLRESRTIIEETSTSLLDIVQTAWGMAVVCFTLLLMKATKYINAAYRQSREGVLRAQFRDNLGILLSKLSRLRRGQHSKELKRMQHYVKHSIWSPVHKP